MADKKREPSRPAQIILILRLVAGLYLVYLAKELLLGAGDYTGSRLLIQIVCTIIFAVSGLVFAAWSLKKLVRKEFMRPGEERKTES